MFIHPMLCIKDLRSTFEDVKIAWGYNRNGNRNDLISFALFLNKCMLRLMWHQYLATPSGLDFWNHCEKLACGFNCSHLNCLMRMSLHFHWNRSVGSWCIHPDQNILLQSALLVSSFRSCPLTASEIFNIIAHYPVSYYFQQHINKW